MGGWKIALVKEISGLVRVRSELVVTDKIVIPGIVAGAFTAADAFGSMGITDKDVRGEPLPEVGFIVGAKLVDRDDDTLSLTVHIFNSRFTPTASKDALAITAADSLRWITSMGFDDGTDIGSAKVHEIQVWNSPFYLPERRLYWQCSTAGTPNIADALHPLIQFFILPFA